MNQVSQTIRDEYKVRKSKRQKEKFCNYIQEKVTAMGYPVSFEKNKDLITSNNIIIGDITHAKILLTAHYDTCAKFPFANFCTPLNIPYYIFFQIVLTLGLFLVSGFCCIFISLMIASLIGQDFGEFLSYNGPGLYLVSIVLFSYIVVAGPANKNNYNDNTSGVITIIEILEKLKGRTLHNVAIVLFDNEEKGLLGSSAFVKKHRELKKNAVVFNFDCVGDGDYMFLRISKRLKKEKDLCNRIEEVFVDEGDKKSLVSYKGIYMSDQMNFDKGIGIAALNYREKTGYYMDKIHTKNDVILDESNIHYFCSKMVSFLEDSI